MNFLTEVIETIERHDDFEVAMLSWISALMPPRDAGSSGSCVTHPEVPCVNTSTPGREQSDNTQPDIQRHRKMAAPVIMKYVAGKLNEGLRKELIQLVGVIVDSRNQVAGFVLIEKDQGQVLQFRKQSISQLEEDGTADGAHRESLKITGKQAAQINAEQDRGRGEDTSKVAIRECNCRSRGR